MVRKVGFINDEIRDVPADRRVGKGWGAIKNAE